MIESNQINLKIANNFFTKDKFNLTLVNKGYVPIIRLISGSLTNTVTMATRFYNDAYSDYVCLDIVSSGGILNGLRNFTNLKIYTGSIKSNIAVQFKFENTTLVNLTISYAFPFYSSFQPFLYTKFGVNFYENPNMKLITVRNIDQYPFQSNTNTNHI